MPGVWFYPGTRRLHVIDGHGAVGSGNDECVIMDELLPRYVERPVHSNSSVLSRPGRM